MIAQKWCRKCRFSASLNHAHERCCDYIGIMNRPRPKGELFGGRCPAFEQEAGKRRPVQDERTKTFVRGADCEWVKEKK